VNRESGNKIIRDVLLASLRIHIPHRADDDRIFGVEMMDELKRHADDSRL
jgi:hypothetical protein